MKSGARLVAIVCAAQIFVQIGAGFWPALLPQMMQRWSLSNSEAGWITAIFFGAYMVAVPVLVTLTDKIDGKRVYLFGVACTVAGHLMFGLFAEGFWSAMATRALAGIGWAGTYMTGLKLLADQVDSKLMSRAVTGHAASIGISGAVSYLLGDVLADQIGWRETFVFSAVTAAIAWTMVALSVSSKPPAPRTKAQGALFDFRPVVRNTSAFAYSVVYCVHTLEMSALRGWGVAFLAFVAGSTGVTEGTLSPALVVTVMALLGTFASVLGNEASIRFGRRRLVATAMILSIGFAAIVGFAGSTSYWLAVFLVITYGVVVWLDSSSVTAGAAGNAEPARRGATLAVHSTLGYAGGFVGPLVVGWTLDLAGGMSPMAWGLAFLVVGLLMVVALAAFLMMKPANLTGDRRG
ncbi:nitrate/nitrite transporter [Reyranella sp.]|jgi:MFS family permease|uniref:MFS transporter n=1 Tax=Reyranella sp. TaxID=1929291 RepID=UPI00271C72FC|nr:MFS transporter [Reyranella sp.]MDO8976290.1 MFS transporter [Reyranella sp.]